jgi:hypothetical protein
MKLFILTWIARVSKIICCGSLLMIAEQSKACGPDFSNYYLTYLLEHYQYGNRFYDLQFDPEHRYYSKGEDFGTPTLDTKKYNIIAWKKILKIETNNQDSLFTDVLYTSNNSETFIANLNNCNNYKTAIIANPEIEKYFSYLYTYKNKYAPNNDDWDYGKYTKSINLETITPYCNDLEKQINETKSNPLQLRYLYLLLRTTHLNLHYSTTINLFEKYKKLCTNQNMLEQNWCEGIVGGAYIKANQQAQGIYYTARVFSKSDDQYREALCTYNQSKKDWQGALAYCKNTADSIAILLLQTAQNPIPDVSMVENIYRINPQHEAIQLLWLREANKLETYLLNRQNNDYELYNSNADEPKNMTAIIKKNNYIKQFVALGNTMLANPNTAHKATIANVLAYYAFRIKQYAMAKQYITIAKKSVPTVMEIPQTEILEQVITLQESQKINYVSVLNCLKKNEKFPKYGLASHINHYLLYNELAPLFMKNKDTNSAYWCYALSSALDADSTGAYIGDYSPEAFNTSTFDSYLLLHQFGISDINKLEKQFIAKKGNNELANYCIANIQFKNGKKSFAELKAKKYMMMQQWDEAIALIPQLPASYLATKTMNPVNVYYNDIINYTPKMDSLRTFSVAKILTLANTLKQNADKKIAKDQYLYGVLLYNLSYYGKAHNVVDNHWSHSNYNISSYYKTDSVNVYYYQNEKQFEAQKMSPLFYNYFYCTDAEAYLHKALDNLQTPEEKTNCLWMLAKCWQKRCPVKITRNKEYGYVESYGDYVNNALKNPYFKQLQTQYTATQAYQNVKGNCDYFKLYLAGK